MSTAAVSGSSIYQELQGFYQNRATDLKQLGSALQNGDLNGAQQAFASLTSLGQEGPFANSEPFSKSGRAQDFATIGQDLQAGDLAGAQTAFAALTGKQSDSTAATATTTPATLVSLTGAAGTTSTVPPPATTEPSIYQQIQAYRQQRQADVAQLGSDLQAGNLSAAQQDFNTLTTLGQNGPNANGQAFQRTDRAQDFQEIGQALQSGNLTEAQSDFTNLAATFGNKIQPPQTSPPVVNPQPVGPTLAPVVNPQPVGPTLAPVVNPQPVGPTLAPVVNPQPVGPTSPPVVLGPPTSPPVVQGPPSTSPPVTLGPPVGPPVSKPPSSGPTSISATVRDTIEFSRLRVSELTGSLVNSTTTEPAHNSSKSLNLEA